MSSRWVSAFTHPKVVLALPLCFLLGYLVDDQLRTSAEFRVLEAERVAKRMGAWAPPPLSDAERASLLAERTKLLKEVEHLRARVERA